MTLRIECPSCKQAFEVSEELKGRTVECGSCEKRFQVTEQVMVRKQEKYFPDELRKNSDLSRFGRAPVSTAPVEFRTTQYQDPPRAMQFGPVPLVRHVSVIAGLLLFLVTALFLYLGTQDRVGALLSDVIKPKRLLLGGFLGLIAMGLIFWGMIRNRLLGFLLGLLGIGGLLALAWFRPIPETPKMKDGSFIFKSIVSEDEPYSSELITTTTNMDLVNDELSLDDVMELTRWQSSIQPHIVQNGEQAVAVIWIKQMEERFKFQIGNFLQQSFYLESRPEFYPRRPGGIFILKGAGLTFDMEKVASIADRLGEIDDVYPELRIVSVDLEGSVISDSDKSAAIKLEDPNEEAFYELNYKELSHLDQVRVRNAVGRLARAQPVRLRSDITRSLVALLGENLDAEFSGEVAEALKVWSELGDGADEVVASIGSNLMLEGKDVPVGIVSFVSDRKTQAAIPLLMNLWKKDSSRYQSYLEKFGSGIESFIWPSLKSTELPLLRSAVSILGQIGTKESVPYLQEAATQQSNDEIKTAFEIASKTIMAR